MTNINEIYKMIHWHSSYGEQLRGIELAKKSNDVSSFIQPMQPEYNKSVWGNCARILYEKSDDILAPYLIQLLEWIQDLNWPGAMIILDRLKNYSEISKLSLAIEECVKKAVASNDHIWLSNILELLDNQALIEALSMDCLGALKQIKVWVDE